MRLIPDSEIDKELEPIAAPNVNLPNDEQGSEEVLNEETPAPLGPTLPPTPPTEENLDMTGFSTEAVINEPDSVVENIDTGSTATSTATSTIPDNGSDLPPGETVLP